MVAAGTGAGRLGVVAVAASATAGIADAAILGGDALAGGCDDKAKLRSRSIRTASNGRKRPYSFNAFGGCFGGIANNPRWQIFGAHLRIATTEPEVRISIFTAAQSLLALDFGMSRGVEANSAACSAT